MTWELYFDGACRTEQSNEGPIIRAGAGLVFLRSDGHVLHFSYSLLEEKTNNQDVQVALIIGFEMALEANMTLLRVYGDSLLVIRQLRGVYAVRNEELISYHEKAISLLNHFPNIEVDHVARSKNSQADALAKLAASLTLPPQGRASK
jgi:ribonuclease HI